MQKFKIRNSYTFNINSNLTGLFNEKYNLMKLIAITDFSQAITYEDVSSKHEAAYPLLTSLPKSPVELTYLVFTDINSNKIVIPEEYIDLTTVTEVKSVVVNIKIKDISTDDISIIKNALSELGYRNINITSNVV